MGHPVYQTTIKSDIL